MEKKTIERVSKYQADNWAEFDGYIGSYNAEDGILIVGTEEFSMNANARKQMAERLGMKGTVKDFEKDLAFMQDAYNRKISTAQKTPSRIIYDTNNMEAKAVKSTRYNRLLNNDVFYKAIDTYEDFFDPKHSFINDNNMYLGFTGVKEVEVKPKNAKVGEIISFGSQVWNSETGNGSLGVGQLLVRLVCTNGMTSKEMLDVARWKHLTFYDLMAKLVEGLNTIITPDKTAKLLSRAMGRGPIVPRINDTTLEGKDLVMAQKPWRTLLSRFQIPKRHHDGIIIRHVDDPIGVSGDGVNAWGIYNAVTGYNSHVFPRTLAYNNMESQNLMTSAYPLLTL